LVKPTFFATAEELREWLERNHATATELLVGFYRRGSGRPSITWQELVDEELCFGWIDGIRKGIDAVSYANRITPRKQRSTWSAINIARAKELIKLGRMHPAGLRAFERRTDERSAIYSYEQRRAARLDPDAERSFRAKKKAWTFFQAQAPSYQRVAIWWVISAKREETRKKRLQTLIHDSQNGRTVGPLSRPVGSRQRIVPVKTAMTMATPSRRKKTPATGRQVDPK
jgi:uncharacterized protein YdeI (YjbR/CyaY-like superfamily)